MLRVCVYCRVSTDKGDQLNSLENQINYFTSYVKENKEWDLVGIYADEGISGTSTKKRLKFNAMIEAAMDNEIDLILTKEVSRFARNTVDALNYTRLLKEYNVGVFFINDNIDTRANDGEFRLSIMASVAQEESRKISERVKWGQLRSMEKGVVFGNNSTFGFETKNGCLTINQEEAEIVKLIFSKFLHEGKGTHVIARELFEQGIKPPQSKSGKWSSSMVLRILKNEKYVGDLLQKKYITVDYLTHKKVLNKDLEKKIYIKDHHEGIISRDIWEKVKAELAKRSSKADYKKHSNRYWCSGKIICSNCGTTFVPKKSTRKDGREYLAWGCHKRIKEGGQSCNMRMINSRAVNFCVEYLLEQMPIDKKQIFESILTELKSLNNTSLSNQTLNDLNARLVTLTKKKKKLLDSYLEGTVSNDDMQLMNRFYDDEINTVKHKIENLKQEKSPQTDICFEENIYKCDNVKSEVVEQIIIYNDFIDVKLKLLPLYFRMEYITAGYKDNYTVIIQSLSLIDSI